MSDKKRKKKRRSKGGRASLDHLPPPNESELLRSLKSLSLSEENDDQVNFPKSLKLVKTAASTKRDHIQRNRVLLHPSNFTSLKPGSNVIVSTDGSSCRVLCTCWPFEGVNPDSVQLSSTALSHFNSIDVVTVEKIVEESIQPCTSVIVSLKGKDQWSQEAVEKTMNEGHVLDYIKYVMKDQYVCAHSVLGLLLNGYSCEMTVESILNTDIGLVSRDTVISIVSNRETQPQDDADKIEMIGGLEKQVNEVKLMLERALSCVPTSSMRIPRGILLHGPPGTGKTLIARCVAHSFNAKTFVINGAEIVSKYLGQAESSINDIFSNALMDAPSVIFIDEIDSLCPSRDSSGNDQLHVRIVSLLLQRLDALSGQVCVIAATNRPNSIDPALRRPGRFDRELHIGVPNEQDRLSILKIHLQNFPVDLASSPTDVLVSFAKSLHGFVGADIMSLCREAGWRALRREVINKTVSSITFEDLLYAKGVVSPSALRELVVQVPKVLWSDVGGQEDIKQQLKEAVEWPLKHPEAFERMGIRPPQGVLLYGPPGCSKTLLAKAIATEGEMNFIAIKGPELFSKWVGESEKAVREVFAKARMSEPSVVFIDEIDALAGSRGQSGEESGVGDRVLSQLLTEMDGIEERKRVVVVAATNRPDIVDDALLRPGRLDRLIYVPPPKESARLEILKIHTKKMPLSADVNLEMIAKECTEGFSGAEVAAICREAAMSAFQRDKNAQDIQMVDFIAAGTTIEPQITPDVLEFYQNLVL